MNPHLWLWCTFGCGGVVPIIFRAGQWLAQRPVQGPWVYVFGTGEAFVLVTALSGNAIERLVRRMLAWRASQTTPQESETHKFIATVGSNLMLVILSSYFFAIAPSAPPSVTTVVSIIFLVFATASALASVKIADC